MNKDLDYYMSLPYKLGGIWDNALDAKREWLKAALDEGIAIAAPMILKMA